ncbi:DnaT-like ssDNA-binding domain-containing protein [Buchnera aphidicola (Taiwanaphis decaspermi)]|uniref:DnaT-like ssDNA-binding domain-containing protein n=1 Tax=Buchnera aphidicola TaxID=9 RepID=UPI0031B86304
MCIKILVSNGIDIKSFCKNPIKYITSTKEGAIAVFDKNKPIMYAVSPIFLNRLLNIENSFIKKNVSHKNINKDFLNTKKKENKGKFAMYKNWKPDEDFLKKSHIWGIMLNKKVNSNELAAFISYWKIEGRTFYHLQWQQKLARSLQQSRLSNKINIRDINDILEPDKITPKGFRGD